MGKNGPNKTVAEFRRKAGPSPQAVEARNRRLGVGPAAEVMERVSKGELTPAEGAMLVAALVANREV